MATEDEDRRLRHLDESFSIMIESESERESERQSHWKKSKVLICKLPEFLRNLNPSAYTPRITSIGPLHKEDKRLSSIDSHKVTSMYRLYSRVMKSTTKGIIQISGRCLRAVIELLPRARACYAVSLHCYDDIKLAEMMVIDGCFILELLFRFQHGSGEGDPIFDNNLVMRDVKHDLMLLENQIPFFILKALFNLTVKEVFRLTSLTKLILYFFNDMNIIDNYELTTNDETVEHCHILGLLQSCYRSKSPDWSGVLRSGSFSATELAGAGVTFKEQTCAFHGDERFLLSVTLKESPRILGFDNLFYKNTSFIIPRLCIKNSNLSFLRNLIAYEQCDVTLGRHYVTSFALLMEKLIDTKDDVSLLVRSKVLDHDWRSSEDVANILKNICKGVVVRDFCYNRELDQLQIYCNRFWPRNIYISRRICRSVYRSATIYAAGAILFVLTLIQTIYAVIG